MKESSSMPHRVSKDIKIILNSSPQLKYIWENLTPIARNEWICYITNVKKVETRKKHILRLEQDLMRGKKRPCCWPGCPHRLSKSNKYFINNIK